MLSTINLEKCLARIRSHPDYQTLSRSEFRPSITLSAMAGADGDIAAVKLADFLQHHAPSGCQWTVFDKNLMTKVLEEHGLSAMLADSLPEAKESLVTALVSKLRAGHPSASKIVELAVETVWRLATGGYVILVGRGTNIVTAELKNVFHVRLVASLGKRVANTQQSYSYDQRTAQNFVNADDEAKRQYVKDYFGQDIDDPELYHLVVNTDRIPADSAAHLIGNAFLNWLKSASAVKKN
jgi:cytidylate kinase